MPKIAIIGAGIAGLTAANYLNRAGIDFIIFEATDKPGGKLQTAIVDGFTLDKGFQVFLTAYPEAKAFLNLSKLKLNYFDPGAFLRLGSKFVEVNDPIRQPAKIFSGLTAPIGNILDKLKILQLSNALKRTSIETIFRWYFFRKIFKNQQPNVSVCDENVCRRKSCFTNRWHCNGSRATR